MICPHCNQEVELALMKSEPNKFAKLNAECRIHKENAPKKHKKVIGNMNYPKDTDITNEDCDGILSYDEALEGHICSKCQYYDGVK